MLLTITTTHRPASDLGFLLHKHPDRMQRFELTVGAAHVVYPEAGVDRCTAALLLEVDPIELVRSARGAAGSGFSLGQYVNDRPYVASSLLAVALAKVFGSAMKGRCMARQELADTAIPLEIRIPVLPCVDGPAFAESLFEPLGWAVSARPVELDPAFPDWGPSRYVDLTLTGTLRLADALTHLYVLLPVLDDGKHYWVAEDEVDKLVRAGGEWLAGHPFREVIATRYLKHQRRYAADALARLTELDDRVPDDAGPRDRPGRPGHDAADERVPSLAEQRRAAIVERLRDLDARRVVDLGCGEGSLLRDLVTDPAFTEIVGVDVVTAALRTAARRLRLDEMPERQRTRVTLRQGSATYADQRLAGFDAVVLMEVIEHVEPARLPAVAATVFDVARPAAVIMTTPNVEYNVRWDALPAGGKRHPDHRFEWTRAEFTAWADQVAARYGYAVRVLPVGPVDAEVGAPTQLAEFRRIDAEGVSA